MHTKKCKVLKNRGQKWISSIQYLYQSTEYQMKLYRFCTFACNGFIVQKDIPLGYDEILIWKLKINNMYREALYSCPVNHEIYLFFHLK